MIFCEKRCMNPEWQLAEDEGKLPVLFLWGTSYLGRCLSWPLFSWAQPRDFLGSSWKAKGSRRRKRWDRHPSPPFPLPTLPTPHLSHSPPLPLPTSRCQEIRTDARRGRGIPGAPMQRVATTASCPSTPPPPPGLALLPDPLTSAPPTPGCIEPGGSPGAAPTPQGPALAPGPRDRASDQLQQGGCRGGRAPAASPPPQAGSRIAGEEEEEEGGARRPFSQ